MAARIDTAGIGDFVRDLGRLSSDMRKALVGELRDIGNDVRDDVRSSTDDPYRTGKLRRSVKVSVRRGAISLYSNLPQAGVWHWGGSIKPRGTPIEIPRTEFVGREVLAQGEHVDERLGTLLSGAARRYRFR